MRNAAARARVSFCVCAMNSFVNNKDGARGERKRGRVGAKTSATRIASKKSRTTRQRLAAQRAANASRKNREMRKDKHQENTREGGQHTRSERRRARVKRAKAAGRPAPTLTGQDKAADARDEAGEKGVERKCADEHAIDKLDDAGRDVERQKRVDDAQTRRRLLFVVGPQRVDQRITHCNDFLCVVRFVLSPPHNRIE